MHKVVLIIVIFSLVVALGVIFAGGEKTSVQNVEIKNGVQYITIDAKGGYSPRTSSAKADIPTKLIIKTDGTYDCSASLVIRSIGFQKIYPKLEKQKLIWGLQKPENHYKEFVAWGCIVLLLISVSDFFYLFWYIHFSMSKLSVGIVRALYDMRQMTILLN